MLRHVACVNVEFWEPGGRRMTGPKLDRDDGRDMRVGIMIIYWRVRGLWVTR